MSIHYTAFSQTKDSLIFKISKVESSDNHYALYTIQVFNSSQIPVCLLHSTYINLGFEPAPKLALFSKDTPVESYTLLYVARDTLNDYDNTNSNLNGEIVLPRQAIEFKLLIPKQSNKEKYLQFDYAYIPNFCYEDFKKNIFNNASMWHQKYPKLRNKIKLPLID